MQKIVHVALVTFLISLTQVAFADEASVCKAGCASQKTHCRADADSKANTDAYPSIQMDDGMVNMDKKRDMRAVLEDKQRREDGQKKMRFERYQDCERDYQQCAFACNPPASPESAKPTPSHSKEKQP